LLKAGILFVDYVKSPFAAHDLAICASLFDGCSYFHNYLFELHASRFTLHAGFPSVRLAACSLQPIYI